MRKETIKPDGADKTLPQVIPPAIVAYVCKLQQAVAREVRERAGCSGLSGLSGFWLNETDQMNRINQMNQTDPTRSVLRI